MTNYSTISGSPRKQNIQVQVHQGTSLHCLPKSMPTAHSPCGCADFGQILNASIALQGDISVLFSVGQKELGCANQWLHDTGTDFPSKYNSTILVEHFHDLICEKSQGPRIRHVHAGGGGRGRSSICCLPCLHPCRQEIQPQPPQQDPPAISACKLQNHCDRLTTCHEM